MVKDGVINWEADNNKQAFVLEISLWRLDALN